METNRNSMVSMMALIKRTVVQAMEQISEKNPLKVKVVNEKVMYSYMSDIVQKLEKLSVSLNNFPKIEFKDTPASLNIQTMGKETIQKLVDSIDELKSIMRDNKVQIPSVQEVKGTVKLEGQQIFPYDRMISSLRSIEDSIKRIKIEIPQFKSDIKFPEFPKKLDFPEGKMILEQLTYLNNEIKSLPKSYPEFEFPKTINANVVSAPPQKYPMPVTNININPLRGYANSRNVTLTSTPKPLPDTPLAYRRSLIIFNNSSQTIYLGGSDVTTSNGLPVVAQSYSPAIDAGPKLIVYGVVASSTADVRCFEASNENIGA